jgi:C4-dicarboxylate-specific signal transduction histidine kinase
MASSYLPAIESIGGASDALDQAVQAASEAAEAASAAIEAANQSEQTAMRVSTEAVRAAARASSAVAAAAHMASEAAAAEARGQQVAPHSLYESESGFEFEFEPEPEPEPESEWEGEVKRLAQHLFHIDRQRAIGHMSAALGHELNQPLTAILSNAQVLQRGLRSKQLGAQKVDELLGRIVDSTLRASSIIEGIRSFILPTQGTHQVLDLHEVVRETLDLMQPDARLHKVRITAEEGESPVPVQGDRVQLSQVLINVLRNAVEALEPVRQREVRIQTRQTRERVSLRITDSGPGLTPQQLQRAGTPFYSTKSGGLGMGLSISRKILSDHRGTLDIGNAENAGVQVTITLPLVAEPLSDLAGF